MMKYIAFVTKGLEEICAEELKQVDGLVINDIQPKYIRFDFSGSPDSLKSLRTIDDIAILISEFNITNSSQEALTTLITEEFAKQQNSIESSLFEIIKNFRTVKNNFSVTISNYKADDINKESLKSSLQKFIKSKYNLDYSELDHSNFDFRINIEESKVFVSLKLFSESLFRRAYNHSGTPGTLRPTIAAAMIFALKLNAGDSNPDNLRLIDSFCGSGTFLCEAHLQGIEVFGGDIKPENVNLTKSNLEKVGALNSKVFVQDATEPKWKSEFFDFVASNYPWGKQVNERNISLLYEKSIKEYSRIIKKDGSLAFIGLKPELVKRLLKQYFPNHKIVEYKIGYLGQTPSIVFAFSQ